MLEKDNVLLVTAKENKRKILLDQNKLVDIKIISLEEIIEKLTYKYTNETIYYLMKKYKLKYEIALIYIHNLKYIKNNNYTNKKLQFLLKLKQELLENNLLIKDKLFKEYLKNKKIYIYSYDYINNYQKQLLKEYNYEIINNDKNNYKTNIYKFKNIEDEVVYVANEISKLINNDIDINKIKITNINENYNNIMKRIFSIYNIPIDINEKISIYETEIGKFFINNIEHDINITLKKIEEKFNLNMKENLDIYNNIINICNKHNFNNDINILKEMLIYDLKNTYKKKEKYKNYIECINFNNININDDQYLFLMNFNNESIPYVYKDEEYLNDEIKKELELETSYELNKIEREICIKKIKNIKNLYITYKLKDNNGEYRISLLNEFLNFNIEKPKINFNSSNLYNKIKLTKLLDEYLKYGIINNELPILYNNYLNIPYRKYNNEFSGIDKENLFKYLDNKLLLSYTSLDNYSKCSFRYYLNNILKLSVYEETFMTTIGNIFHQVLSKMPDKKFDLEIEYNKAILDTNKKYTKKELFFLNKLKEELNFVIETIKKQQEYISLDKTLFEEKIYIYKDKNIKITFMGIIDKLLYKEENDKTIVAIIDYKTGNPNLDLNKTIYGIDMQLPVYIYLAKNTNKLKNVEIAGFYLQKILNNEITIDYKNTYEKLKEDNLKLQGYSNENEEIIKYIDNNYQDSNLIKSLKTSSKGFYSYSKLLSTNKIELLSDIVDKKIDESIEKILNADFEINPKRISSRNIGCEYCKFKDICYMKEEDIKDLKEYKNLEFLEEL